MADLQEQDPLISDGITSAMANLSHDESFFSEANQTVLEKAADEDNQMKETDGKADEEEKVEKKKKDCRRSMCLRVKKEVCLTCIFLIKIPNDFHLNTCS